MNGYQSMNTVDRMGVRSLMTHAAGSPVIRTAEPRIRKVHAGPTFWIKPSMVKLMTAPPRPPAAKTMPFARPRFLLKY